METLPIIVGKAAKLMPEGAGTPNYNYRATVSVHNRTGKPVHTGVATCKANGKPPLSELDSRL